MILQFLLPSEMLSADFAIRMLRFGVNLFVRGTSALVGERFIAEVALVAVDESREVIKLIRIRTKRILRLIIEVNSLMSNEIGSLDKSFVTETTFLTQPCD